MPSLSTLNLLFLPSAPAPHGLVARPLRWPNFGASTFNWVGPRRTTAFIGSCAIGASRGADTEAKQREEEKRRPSACTHTTALSPFAARGSAPPRQHLRRFDRRSLPGRSPAASGGRVRGGACPRARRARAQTGGGGPRRLPSVPLRRRAALPRSLAVPPLSRSPRSADNTPPTVETHTRLRTCALHKPTLARIPTATAGLHFV